MNLRLRLCSSFVILAALSAAAFSPVCPLRAADAESAGRSVGQIGSISGRVRNQATGAYLQDAQIVLQPSGLATLTSRDGRFNFSLLSEG